MARLKPAGNNQSASCCRGTDRGHFALMFSSCILVSPKVSNVAENPTSSLFSWVVASVTIFLLWHWMSQKKMAAPCSRMASRSVLQFLSCFSRTAVGNTGFRQFSRTPLCRATLQTKNVTERATSPWTLMAAVCLQRLPVISADYSPIEQQFGRMMRQVRLIRMEEV